MSILAIQYLEAGPGVADLPPEDVRAKLRAAFERLPISLVLLGWNLPDALVDACADECARADAQLYRWQPLLTGDGSFAPRPEWQTIALDGQPVPGFQDRPEFTFACPNRPAAREAVLSHVRDVLGEGRYEGIFLDRIRYPSPAVDPASALACFCPDCQRAAAQEGLDLEALQRDIARLLGAPEGAQQLARGLLDAGQDGTALAIFLGFRSRSVTRFVHEVADLAHQMGVEVGLDCFSPALTRLVGQDLDALGGCCEWVKIMSYAHALGPAGLPFELLGLADWLVGAQGMDDAGAMALLSDAARLPLPLSRADLREGGLPPATLGIEAERGRASAADTLLAGIELVDVEGITRLNPAQISADLRALRAAGADGLVLSWDLWHIPLERLEIVRDVWD